MAVKFFSEQHEMVDQFCDGLRKALHDAIDHGHIFAMAADQAITRDADPSHPNMMKAFPALPRRLAIVVGWSEGSAMELAREMLK